MGPSRSTIRAVSLIVPLMAAPGIAHAQGGGTQGAGAAGGASAGASASSQIHVTYSTYAVGMDVANMEAGFGMGPYTYQMRLAYQTTGLVGLFLRGHQVSLVDGTWRDGQPAPREFSGDGIWRGVSRTTLIDYTNGQPNILALTPPNEAERLPVPPEMQRNTVDSLSAIALLMHRVATTGRCEAKVATFDGRRLADIDARTVGEEVLARTDRSSYAGPALRCDFDGRMLAGFMIGEDTPEHRKLQHGSAWLASVLPGTPPVPVKMSFTTHWFGDAVMYLTSAAPGMPDLAVSQRQTQR